MKRMFIMLLVALLMLSGCSTPVSGNTASPEAVSSETAVSTEIESAGTEAETEPVETEAAADDASAENHELTLADAQVRFVYAEDGYLLLAYNGPHDDIGYTFCKADGTLFSQVPFPYGILLGSGWVLIYTTELSDDFDVDSITLRITDYNADGEERLFSDFGDAMTDDELREIGVTFFEGHASCITDSNRVLYDSDEFGILISFRWIAEDKNMTYEDWPFSVDDFAFFAGDGTPLADAFEGYTFEVGPRYNDMYAVFTSNTSTSEEDNEKNCDVLAGLKPYMIYTAKDGTTQRFDLLVNY